MKTLAKLQAECAAAGLVVRNGRRLRKEAYLEALRRHLWSQQFPDESLPSQILPMLLSDWNDLGPKEITEIEADQHEWAIQPKLDGIRTLMIVGTGGVRITGRKISEVTYRLTEHQNNVPHLIKELEPLSGTILDGELLCPANNVDTGATVTANALQAAVAILATTPENASQIQDRQNVHLEFHVFDVLRWLGQDTTILPLHERFALLSRIVERIGNDQIKFVPHGIIGKQSIHERVLAEGGEGTVYKRLNQPYEPGRRVKHWIKRKRTTEVEAFVSGFKPGNPHRGNNRLIGAVEFSLRDPEGNVRPVAWVNNWTDSERRAMTRYDDSGKICLVPAFFERRAIIAGQDESAKSHRLRHARLSRWLDSQ